MDVRILIHLLRILDLLFAQKSRGECLRSEASRFGSAFSAEVSPPLRSFLRLLNLLLFYLCMHTLNF